MDSSTFFDQDVDDINTAASYSDADHRPSKGAGTYQQAAPFDGSRMAGGISMGPPSSSAAYQHGISAWKQPQTLQASVEEGIDEPFRPHQPAMQIPGHLSVKGTVAGKPDSKLNPAPAAPASPYATRSATRSTPRTRSSSSSIQPGRSTTTSASSLPLPPESPPGKMSKPKKRPSIKDDPVDDEAIDDAVDEDAGEKRSKFLLRNRVAAKKCRTKKKEYYSELEEARVDLELQRAQLQLEHKTLLAEVVQMKDRLMAHAGCRDANINIWLEQQAQKFVGRSAEPLPQLQQPRQPQPPQPPPPPPAPAHLSAYTAGPYGMASMAPSFQYPFETPMYNMAPVRRPSIAFSHEPSLQPSPIHPEFPGLAQGHQAHPGEHGSYGQLTQDELSSLQQGHLPGYGLDEL